MPNDFTYPFLLLAVGALLLPGRIRRMGLLGLVPFGLAAAAFTVRLGDGLGQLALRAAERSAPLGFLHLNAGLTLLGLVLAITAGVVAMATHWSRPLTWVAVVMVGAGVAPVIGAMAALFAYTGWVMAAAAAAGIGAGAAGIFLLGRVTGGGNLVRRLDELLERHSPPVVPPARTSFDITWLAGFYVAGAVMVVAPTLRAVSLAAVIAATVSHVLLRRTGSGTRVPAAPLLVLVLVSVHQYFAAVTGDPNPVLAELASAPLSPAGETRVVPWLGLAALGLAGLWPLHGMVLPLAAPLAGVLLLRLGTMAVPDGMEHWAPLFFPIALLGVWHAALTLDRPARRPRRAIELLTGLAVIGAFAGPAAVPATGWLLAAAAALPWLHWLAGPAAARGARWAGGATGDLLRLAWLPLAWAALEVVTAALAVQVTYTLLAAGGIAAAIQVYYTRKEPPYIAEPVRS